MPVIIVYGIPRDTKEGHIVDFCKAVYDKVAGVKELRLESHQVSCFCPLDALPRPLANEIIIIVEGLLKKPERTQAVREKLADALNELCGDYFPNTKVKECFIKPFDSEWGFSQILG